jgi:hypothetical protein
MRGRIASFAIGSAVASRRTEARMSQQAQSQQAQQQAQAQAQAQSQQKEIDQLKASQAAQAQPAQAPQEDITQKLQKLADLHKQGILSDEEYQKTKTDLLAKL